MRERVGGMIGACAWLLCTACVVTSESRDSTHVSASPASSAPKPPDTLVFSADAFGPIRMCAPLDSVAVLARDLGATSVRDTVIESEGERWPAKRVALGDGGIALFESSWMDTTRVWRFSTTSARARTAHGAHVGARVRELPATSGPFAVEVAEGAVGITLSGEGVGARVDSASERAVLASVARERDTLRAPPASARVMELIAAGRCGTRR